MSFGVERLIISFEDKLTPNFSFNNNCNFIADNELPPLPTKSSSIKIESVFKTSLNASTT